LWIITENADVGLLITLANTKWTWLGGKRQVGGACCLVDQFLSRLLGLYSSWYIGSVFPSILADLLFGFGFPEFISPHALRMTWKCLEEFGSTCFFILRAL
jgi:hypothetical protein